MGLSKVEIAKQIVIQRQRTASVDIYQQNILSVADLEPLHDVDLIVVAGDYPSYRELGYLVQSFCFDRKIPISFAGGYSAHIGKIYPLVIPGETACFDCISRQVANESNHLGRALRKNTVHVSTTVQMGDFITGIVSFEILKYLSGAVTPFLINKSLIVSFRTYEVRKREFKRQKDCAYCSAAGGDFL
jgi:molybdopterin-synthase adenylyltransferase